ncbi:MAG TPA: DUF937 domain-containing protein [Beijerinckiaceae bacterium]|nr:DUF937 domain-containing protein [Beijerinckiaceae bacterium]
MMNLADILANAHGGAAFQSLARQYGLSTEQAEAAVNAMLPAFSLGLQQQAQSADGLINLMSMLGSGTGEAAFEDPTAAASKQMLNSGKEFMTQIFGGTQQASKEVQAQVVQQAAALTGIGNTVLQKMLPMIASIILGGLFKGAMNNGLGGIIEQVLKGGLGQATAPRQGQDPMGDLLGGILGQVLGGLTGGQARPQPQQQADPITSGIDILKGMFETGQTVQEAQMSGLQNIFDEILKAQKR